MSNDLINECLKKHGIYQSQPTKIERINQFPHMFIIHFQMYKLIVKSINKNRLFCQNIDEFYDVLSKIEYIELPKLTTDGNYSFNYNEEIILVYRELMELNTIPNSDWWANCLNSIHNTSIDNLNFKEVNLSLEEITKFIEKASKYWDNFVKNKINSLLKYIENENFNFIANCVLSHNDPGNYNVLRDNNKYKLIDTEGMRLLPKEFDIQRLFHGIVNSSDDLSHSLNYWHTFIINYEKKENDKIDINLLKKIYVYDLIRTFSWLSIVTKDDTRLDRERQSKQLELYQKSIIEEKHLKVLKKI